MSQIRKYLTCMPQLCKSSEFYSPISRRLFCVPVSQFLTMNKVAIVTVVLLSVFLGYQFANKFDPGEILFTSVT